MSAEWLDEHCTPYSWSLRRGNLSHEWVIDFHYPFSILYSGNGFDIRENDLNHALLQAKGAIIGLERAIFFLASMGLGLRLS